MYRETNRRHADGRENDKRSVRGGKARTIFMKASPLVLTYSLVLAVSLSVQQPSEYCELEVLPFRSTNRETVPYYGLPIRSFVSLSMVRGQGPLHYDPTRHHSSCIRLKRELNGEEEEE